ncbi:MAG TPA: UDP-3-O-(3-hydroxymyristoyl)glucosamine N-acyltransferase [Porticoccaceae bacterium]|nr:UDP-3-O-(3-hydroxymyristoyl)glucosamine N-acyltransferase [Porticoccaceae bacterium]HCO59742.1 UDP-3-O-(3-hydroxymyristoyl)glucosamine N-acyltransferase [Porticoccaceae bacterium]
MTNSYSLRDCADFLGAELVGDPDRLITGLNSLSEAGPGDLTFLANKTYRQLLSTTRAAAVILASGDAPDYKGNALVLKNPYAAYARMTAWFNNAPASQPGRHPSSVIADSAAISPEASIGPCAVIGEGVVIAPAVVVGAGTWIGNDCSIGESTLISANVSIYHGVSIGAHCRIHSGAVIGADGFGFANDGGEWVKIHQLGGVKIGDRVEIGACTTIDRGALGDTVIDDGVVLDNHVQVAHNVKIGENTAMAAYAGIAGSTTIGKNCIFAGQSGAVGHVTICDNVQAMARTALSKSIDKPGSYSSGIHMYETAKWRKNAARFGQLDDMARRLKALEQKLK